MMEHLAWGANLAVLGFFLAIVPLLPWEKTWARTFVVAVTLIIWLRYLAWRITSTAPPAPSSWSGAFFFVGLAIEILMFVGMVIYLVILCRYSDRSREADRHEHWLRSLPPEKLPTVDIFLTTYNEGREFVERGIVAAKAMDYPRFQIWVLDDGRRDWLRDLCAQRQVGYIRRDDNKHAKAGNVNNALKLTHGELFAIFDADFTPHRNFLYRTVGFFFADPRITIVQTPQHFFNPDVFQINLGLSDVMQGNEREWYDVVLASRDGWDRAFCCGTSAIFRRDAMERLGGLATESVTEDILTTAKMLPDGYITRYLNERLSLGLAPENVNSLLIQRRRWARGGVQLMYLMFRQLRTRLSLADWFFFFPLHYFLDFPCRILFALLPLVYLWTGYIHFYVRSTAELLAYQGPPMLCTFLIGRWLIPHARTPLLSSATQFYLSAKMFPTVVSSLIKPFGTPFRVTPKGKSNQPVGSDPTALWWLALLIAITVGGIVVGSQSSWRFYSPTGMLIATCWALCNLVLFGLTLLSVSQRPQPRIEERFLLNRAAGLTAGDRACSCRVINLSLSGALIDGASKLNVGESVQLHLDGVGSLMAKVVRTPGGRAGIHFIDVPEPIRDRLIEYLYTTGLCNEIREVSPTRVLWRLLRGALLGSA